VDEFLSEKEQIQYIREWWQENRSYILTALIIVIGGITGNNAWKSSIIEKQLSASSLYESLAVEISENNLEAGEIITDQISEDYSDTVYYEKAKLAMAYFYMSQSRDEDAANSLRSILSKSSDSELSLIAEMRLAKIMLYQKKYQEVIDMLKGNTGHAFETKYSELLGDAYFGLDEFDKAEFAYMAALQNTNQAQIVDASLIQMKINDLPDNDDLSISSQDKVESGSQ
jgi:predicted negative regulator of RcsB-dependent stress response